MDGSWNVVPCKPVFVSLWWDMFFPIVKHDALQGHGCHTSVTTGTSSFCWTGGLKDSGRTPGSWCPTSRPNEILYIVWKRGSDGKQAPHCAERLEISVILVGIVRFVRADSGIGKFRSWYCKVVKRGEVQCLILSDKLIVPKLKTVQTFVCSRDNLKG